MIQSYLSQASTYAGEIDFLFDMIFWIVGVWFRHQLRRILSGWSSNSGSAGDEGDCSVHYGRGEIPEALDHDSPPPRSGVRRLHHLGCGACLVRHQAASARARTEEVRVITQQWAWTFRPPGAGWEVSTLRMISTP